MLVEELQRLRRHLDVVLGVLREEVLDRRLRGRRHLRGRRSSRRAVPAPRGPAVPTGRRTSSRRRWRSSGRGRSRPGPAPRAAPRLRVAAVQVASRKLPQPLRAAERTGGDALGQWSRLPLPSRRRILKTAARGRAERPDRGGCVRLRRAREGARRTLQPLRLRGHRRSVDRRPVRLRPAAPPLSPLRARVSLRASRSASTPTSTATSTARSSRPTTAG